MREFGMGLNQILQSGYFEVKRLWSICDELRARELSDLTKALDITICTEEYRGRVFEWLKGRQPRINPAHGMDPEIMKEFLDKWNTTEATNG